MDKIKWTDFLPTEVYTRLGACHNTKSDLCELVKARWTYYQKIGKDLQGFTREDALIFILELLDCNGQFFDPTKEEYNELAGKF